jgi:hypothetical protein
MIERILDECSQRRTCPLNRKEFDETFTGADLTIQVRAAIDFAQQHDLAFARSTGDQLFVFSRLPKAPEPGRGQQPRNGRNGRNGRREKQQGQGRHHRPGSKRKSQGGAARRPIGRSF